MSGRILTDIEFAGLINVKVATIRSWIRMGEIPGAKLPGRAGYLLDLSEIKESLSHRDQASKEIQAESQEPGTRFEDWVFSARARNILRSMGITTWEQLCSTSVDDLRKQRNCGEYTVIEITKKASQWRNKQSISATVRS